MIDELKSVENSLRVAWDDYYRVCSKLENHNYQVKPLGPYDSASEACHLLDAKVDLLSSYEVKIQEAKALICRARNYSSGISPINILPPEILARIFQLVVVQQPCDLHQLSPTGKEFYPRYPDYLTHICSLWRKIAISSRFLWCHIDLLPHKTYFTGIEARARAYVARSGELPLELHIAGEEDWGDGTEFSDRERPEFISEISTRVDTVAFVTKAFGCFHSGALCELLLRQPPHLTKLVIRSNNKHHDVFILPSTEQNEIKRRLDLKLTPDQLESGFAHLKILHLHGIFPLWSSSAYHGLVDLRLLSTRKWSSITEAELIIILDSSPGLRILHFELEISKSQSKADQITPIKLQDLQVVKMFPHYHAHEDQWPGKLLRLLAPGTKPLRLFIDGYDALDSALVAELEAFLARSTVTKFYSKATFPPMSILRHAKDLEYVAFDCSDQTWGNDIPLMFLPVDEFGSLPRLRSLHFVRWPLLESELTSLVEYCPNGIALYSCDVDRQDGDVTAMLSAEELSHSFPNVRIAESSRYSIENPMIDWDNVD